MRDENDFAQPRASIKMPKLQVKETEISSMTFRNKLAWQTECCRSRCKIVRWHLDNRHLG